MHDEFVPPTSEIQAWIERIFSHGIRRPGYPADRWTEGFCIEQFRKLGLEKVRLEPVKLPYWEPLSWSLRASGVEGDLQSRVFPVAALRARRRARARTLGVRSGPPRVGFRESRADRGTPAALRPVGHRLGCARSRRSAERKNRRPAQYVRRPSADPALRSEFPGGDGARHRRRRQCLHRLPLRPPGRQLPLLRSV